MNFNDEQLTDFAKSAYHAYGQVTDFKNYQGLPMPEWEALTERIQAAWKGAVKQVIVDLKVRGANDEPLTFEG